MNSIWTETAKRPQFERLEGERQTDVLIIGGGISGILCAYHLKRAGVDCVVAEARRICGGITQNTTAKITLQHGLIYDQMIRRFGTDAARAYFRAQNLALKEYRALAQRIDCDYEERPSFVYSLEDFRKIEAEAEALERIGCPASVTRDLPLPFSVAGAVRIDRQAQFHPLKFLYALAEELPIYENTEVLKLERTKAFTPHGKITFQKAIVATHFPFLRFPGAYFLKLYQHRSYVLALENAPQLNGMYVDESDRGLSFRNERGALLLGGGSHRTGKDGGSFHELERFYKKHYPEAKEVCRWATQDCMSLDGIAYIGQYAPHTPDLYVATGFNKWGMTCAMAAAMILTDLVRGIENDCASVFSPRRSVLRPLLAVNAAQSLLGLLTPTAPRCPHMGCALKYNAQEHSWDCSCHGSRFETSGKVIDNPATADKAPMPEPGRASKR